jgi:hypothetical protein
MPRGVPVPDETRAEILRLHGEDYGRNAIARVTGISAAEVTRTVHRAGLAFDRAPSELATRARQIDLGKARVDLAERMMVVAMDTLDMVDEPYEVFHFGKEGEFTSAVLAQPPIEARRSMVVTAAIAFDKATKVVEKQNPGLEGAVGLLDTIIDTASAAVAKMRADAGETPLDGDDEDDGVRLPEDA